ncbi:hypothetical protein MTE1_4644 [Klebsiella pneumoniae JHCK1]|nr:hypothetical protein MTE1_4644 [Klebsiella pneumoniae JHCK1]
MICRDRNYGCAVFRLLFYHVFRHYQGHRRYDNALDVCRRLLYGLHMPYLYRKIDGWGILQESCHRKRSYHP